MEIHGETGAIVIGDAMAQDTAGTVELHSGEGVEPIDVDVSEDLYHINVRAFAAAVRGEGRSTASGEDGLRPESCPRRRRITEDRQDCKSHRSQVMHGIPEIARTERMGIATTSHMRGKPVAARQISSANTESPRGWVPVALTR